MSLRGRRAWWIGAAAIVVVAAVIVTVVALRGGGTATAAPSTSKVTRGVVSTTISAAGTVQARASRTLGFSSTGTLTELNVKPGDDVTPGQVLAKIDDSAAQDAVDSAAEAVDSAQTAVDNANAELNATPSACPSTPAAGGRAAASANPCTTTQAQRGSSGTDALLSAQQRLNNAELTLKQAEARRDGTVITAPIAGKVLSVAGSIGAQGGNNFLVLAGTSDVVVQAEFTEAEIAHLALKQTAEITLPDQAGTSYTGSVIQIDPAGTISTRLVRYGALISFDKIPTSLLYGQSADIAVTTASASNVLFVPSTAISDRKGATGSVSVEVGGRIEKRTVQLGLRGDVDTEVTSGLAEGDDVLTSAAT
jgi:RND family efflux transporter MFP subunit